MNDVDGTSQFTGRRGPRLGDVAACFASSFVAMLQGFAAFEAATSQDWVGSVYYAVVAIALGIGAFLSLVRGPAVAARMGWRPRAIALIGNFAIIPLALVPLTWRPDWLITSTTIAIVLVYCWVVWALLSLKRGFSVFPEARVLITAGPYAHVRHPLYAAYLLVYVLVLAPRLSVIGIVIAVLGGMSEILRARNEEHILRSVFPEYESYAARVPAFFPWTRSESPDAEFVLAESGDVDPIAA